MVDLWWLQVISFTNEINSVTDEHDEQCILQEKHSKLFSYLYIKTLIETGKVETTTNE